MSESKLVTKRLFITRHGHADFNASTDFERVLTPQGISAVQNTAQFIKKTCTSQSLSPQLCLSSAATRTKQTAEIICQTNNINHCQYHKKLYCTSVSSWLDFISREDAETLIIVGHNPTFSQMINVFCGIEVYMQPANCAFITLALKPDGLVYPATLHELYQNESTAI